MNKNIQLSSTVDAPLLIFLWRCKLATTTALWIKCFPNRTLKKAYMRLRKLEHGGYIQAHFLFPRTGSAWGLMEKGFAIVREALPSLREEGFLSESKLHDLLVADIHFGEWLLDPPSHVEIFTEQELRSFDLSVYPSWVPPTKVHRPDGYWHLTTPDGPCTIALEAELSQKRAPDYDKIRIFYDINQGVSKVLWVAKTPSLATMIHNRMQESTKHKNKHNFVHLSTYLTLRWNAPIIMGPDKQKTVSEMLGYQWGTAGKPVPHHHFLDIRKSPHKSKTYRLPNFH